MKKTKMAVFATILMAFCATLFSFSAPKGGDVFEIYVNNKMLLQRFVERDKGGVNLVLQNNPSDQLRITYSHCGTVGKDRNLILKDDQNKVVKEWHFSDVTGTDNGMTCKVKDILDVRKGTAALQLYYSSKELPKGRLLASVTVATTSTTKP